MTDFPIIVTPVGPAWWEATCQTGQYQTSMCAMKMMIELIYPLKPSYPE